MNEMYTCSNCGARVAGPTSPEVPVLCKSCGQQVYAISSRGANPYNQETLVNAMSLLEEIMKLLSLQESSVQQAVLYLLEDAILGNTPGGHRVTVKVGHRPFQLLDKCSVCMSQATGQGLVVELRDRWRNTATFFRLCPKHSSEGFYSGDIDLQQSDITPWLGAD